MRILGLRPFDWLALLVALATVAFFARWAWAGSTEASHISIASEEGEFIYPLDEDQHLVLSGPLGDTHIEIRDGRAHVNASPCRDKICIIGGWIDNTDEWLACLPNRIFIRIDGGSTSDLDARSF